MSFNNPQNPFDFMLAQLQGGVSALTGGIQNRVQEGQREQDRQQAEDRQVQMQMGLNAQNMASQEQQLVGQLISEIGEDDPELVSALTQYREELGRGIMTDPRRAAQLLGQINVQLQRQVPGAPVVDESKRPGENSGIVAAEHPSVATSRLETETLSGPQLLSRAQAKAGEVSRSREEERKQDDRNFQIHLRTFEDGLATARQQSQNEWQFGATVMSTANTFLQEIRQNIARLPEDQREQYRPLLVAAATLATADSPAQAAQLWSQGESFGGDFQTNLASLAGRVDKHTRRQERIINRFDATVAALAEKKDVDPAYATQVLEELETYVLPFDDTISPEELNMVRAFINSPSAVWTRDDYKKNPGLLATGLQQYANLREGAIDLVTMKQENPNLYEVYISNEGYGREALRQLQHAQEVDANALATASSEKVQRAALGDATMYKSLNDEEKGEVRNILGMGSVSDQTVVETLNGRNARAIEAAEAQWRRQVAESEAAQYAASTAMPRDVATLVEAGNVVGLRLFEQATGDTVAAEAYEHAETVRDNKLRQLEADTTYREATAGEALRKAQQGEALNDVEVAALRAQYELNAAKFASDLNRLTFLTDAEAITTLSTVAQAVGADFWSSDNLPASLRSMVEQLGIQDSLVALGESSDFLRGQPKRQEAYNMAAALARSIPADPVAQADRLRQTLLDADISPGMADAYVRFVEGSWTLMGAAERRAEAAEGRADAQLELARREDGRSQSRLVLDQQRYNLQVMDYHRRGQEARAKADAETAAAQHERAKEVLNLGNAAIDNERQALNESYQNLANESCAVPASMFESKPQYMPGNTAVSSGTSCAVLVQEHQQQYAAYQGMVHSQLEFVNSLSSESGWDLSPQLNELNDLGLTEQARHFRDPSRTTYTPEVVELMTPSQIVSAARSFNRSPDEERVGEFGLLYDYILQRELENGRPRNAEKRTREIIEGKREPRW